MATTILPLTHLSDTELLSAVRCAATLTEIEPPRVELRELRRSAEWSRSARGEACSSLFTY
jgi:hypothetical protein